MRSYVELGGTVMVLGTEGSDLKSNSYLNDLIEPYGITLNNDHVLRSVYNTYFDPKASPMRSSGHDQTL